MTEIVAINRMDKVALTDDGAVLPFDKMIDCDGEDTEDARLATVVIVEMPSGQWAIISLSEFDQSAQIH